MPKESVKSREITDIREPEKYNVLIHNDDFTTMDLVVYILEHVFFKSKSEALALMLKVHHSEKAVVGTYTYDIARSKADKATAIARENGAPLRLSVVPAE